MPATPTTAPKVLAPDDLAKLDETFFAMVNLDFPLRAGDIELTQIIVRQPRQRDINAARRAAALGAGADEIVLAASLAGLPEEVVEALDATDFKKLAGLMRGLLADAA